MLIDTAIDDGGKHTIDLIATASRDAEAEGLDGVWATEVKHDPFLTCGIAVQNSRRVTVGTSIAVAFARSPMTVATTAFDLQCLSEGRFVLGLGSQIKAHIERRFNMAWSSPAARMREYIQALHAIWDSWATGDRLDFRGDFYQHTLMTPMFSPGANPFGPPRVLLAAVGEQMTQAAAAAADGLIVHSFSTARYLREVTLPIIAKGLQDRGLPRREFQVSYPVFVATGDTEPELARAVAGVRKQIAFYGSTPAYRAVLELHGWGELHTRLNGLSKRGEWDRMTEEIDDEVFDEFAVRGPVGSIGAQLVHRFAGLIDRTTFYTPDPLGARQRARLIADIRAAG
jgi:probable F420-dependent oxidoreductase